MVKRHVETLIRVLTYLRDYKKLHGGYSRRQAKGCRSTWIISTVCYSVLTPILKHFQEVGLVKQWEDKTWDLTEKGHQALELYMELEKILGRK